VGPFPSLLFNNNLKRGRGQASDVTWCQMLHRTLLEIIEDKVNLILDLLLLTEQCHHVNLSPIVLILVITSISEHWGLKETISIAILVTEKCINTAVFFTYINW